MAARRRTCFSASLLFLVFILSLAIKNRYFCQPDGVSITLRESDEVTEETHIYSSLFAGEVHENLHTGEERVPYVYYFYYVAISKCVRDLKFQV